MIKDTGERIAAVGIYFGTFACLNAAEALEERLRKKRERVKASLREQRKHAEAIAVIGVAVAYVAVMATCSREFREDLRVSLHEITQDN